MSVKIAVVGDLLADLTLHTDRLPRPHQTTQGHGFMANGTGTGLLQAVTAARLGAEVTLIARVGQDVNGSLVLDILQREGIHAGCIKRDGDQPTGVRVTFAETVRRTMSAVTRGANAYLRPSDIDDASAAIGEAQALVTQFAVPPETVHHALNLARRAEVKAVLKPTPFRVVPVETLRLPDVFTPNQEELRELAVQTQNAEMPPHQITVCTLGRQGAQWFRKGDDGTPQTDRVNGFSVRAVDDSGAGAVFSAALAVGLGEAKMLADAIRFANAAAALSTTQRGMLNSIPKRAAVEELLAKTEAP